MKSAEILSKLFLDEFEVEYFKSRTLSKTEQKNIVDFVDNNRTLPQLFYNVKKLSEAGIDVFSDTYFEKLEKKHDDYIDKVTILKENVKKLNDDSSFFKDVVFLKGFHIDNYYPEKDSRFIRDIDMLVINDESFFDKVDRLHTAGFTLDYSMWMMKLHDNRIVGASEWVQNGHGDHIINFDIHFGDYLYNGRSMNIDFRFNEIKFDESNQIRVLETNHFILLLLSHIQSHSRIMMRDVNDMYVILNELKEEIDWTYLRKEIGRLGLKSCFSLLQNKMNEVYKLNYTMLDQDAQKKVIRTLPYFMSNNEKLLSQWQYFRKSMDLLNALKSLISLNNSLRYIGFLKKYVREGRFEKFAIRKNKSLKFSSQSLDSKKPIVFMSLVSLGYTDLTSYNLRELAYAKKLNIDESLNNSLMIVTYSGNSYVIGNNDIYIPCHFTVLTEDDLEVAELLIEELIS